MCYNAIIKDTLVPEVFNMSRPELDQIKRRYAEIADQLDTLAMPATGLSETDALTAQELMDEQGKIEHWLWALEPD